MATYRVELTRNAAKEIKNLPDRERRRLVRLLENLASGPRPAGTEKLRENPSFYRLCLGRDYRLVYTVDDKEKLVLIALVRNRKDAYRGLGDLDAARLLRDIEPLRSQIRPQGQLQ